MIFLDKARARCSGLHGFGWVRVVDVALPLANAGITMISTFARYEPSPNEPLTVVLGGGSGAVFAP